MRRRLAWFLAAMAFAVPVSARVARVAEGWRDYSPRQRYEALRNYRQHEALPSDRQQNIERNYQRWRNMPEPERERMRQNYQRYQQLPPEQRKQLQQRYRGQPQK